LLNPKKCRDASYSLYPDVPDFCRSAILHNLDERHQTPIQEVEAARRGAGMYQDCPARKRDLL
jgi:hypothetical protein